MASEPNDYDVTEAMTIYGGSFAKQLAEAARCADPVNLNRIKAAFPELWDEYREMARLRRARQSSEAAEGQVR